MRARSDAFVVSVRSRPSIAVEALDERLELLAEQRLPAREADLLHAELREHPRHPLELLEREELLAVHEAVVLAEHRLRHAVRAAEVAAVGDRDAEVADGPSQRVDGVHTKSVLGDARAAGLADSLARCRAAGAPILALVAVTAIWGYTFVPVQKAVDGLPAVRVPRRALRDLGGSRSPRSRGRRSATLPRAGWAAGALAGGFLAAAYAFQTAGLDLTTVSSTGFITGLYVVFTPILALVLFRTPVPARRLGRRRALARRARPDQRHARRLRRSGTCSCSANAVAQSFQIVAMERFAPRYDARALTFLQMVVSCAAFVVIALAAGQLEAPDDAQTWYALVVTGVFAGALGYLVATWVQSRETAARTALVFTLEAPFAALFGVLLLSERARRGPAGRAAR